MTRSLSRRRFLMGSAALAAPLFVPRFAFGANDRITIASIGVGGRGNDHLGGMLGNRATQVIAVCDPQGNKCQGAKAKVEARYAAEKAQGSYKGCQATSDFREIVVRDDLDAVIIASPEYWHALHTVGAVKNGKDVYCEKAMTLTVAEGRAVVDAVRRHGRVFQLGTQQRSGGNFRFACELARNGYLGEVQTVQVGVPGGRSLPNAAPSPVPPDLDYEMWLGPAPEKPYNKIKCSYNWYFIYDYCVGWIQSWGVHHVDIAQWGAPSLREGKVDVEGTATFPTDGLADTSISWQVVFTKPDGLKFSFTDNRKHPQGCRFVGDEGWVHVSRGGIKAEPASLLKTALKPADEHLYVSNNHHGNWLDCIRTRRDPVANVEQGHTATVLTLVSDIATRLGRKLTWDWETETFAGDARANRMLHRPMRAPWVL